MANVEGTDKKEHIKEEVKEAKKEVKQAYEAWIVKYMKMFVKKAFEWVLVYLCGYYNASFGWLLAPLFFLVLRRKKENEKKLKFDIVKSLANTDEKELLQEIQKFSNLPSWVTFPDMERVEWVNKMIMQLWPYAGKYTKDLCTSTIEPAIREALKDYKLPGFKFEKIILGDTPARFSGMKVYDDTSRHEIILDGDFTYAGDCKFEVSIAKFKAGIKDLQVSGRIRVVMKPLVRQIPLVGGLQVFFLNNPDIDFNLIGIADVFDMPGVSDILRNIVTEQIANIMVLPNRYPIQLVQDIDIVELKAPLPAGVIRIELLEAKNLMRKDIAVLGMGKSDPYCVLRVGAQKFQTKTINNSVSPVWNYCCEFIVDAISYQEVDFHLYDQDDTGSDENLGRANLVVQTIYNRGAVDMWVPLSEAESGRIHIKATWLDLSDSEDSLKQEIENIKILQNKTENPLHSALLSVWVDSASKLNPSHKNIPDPFVRLNVGNTKEETVSRLRTNDPIFEEGFTFLVRNPRTQELLVEVIDSKTNQSHGRLHLDLNSILSRKNLEIRSEDFALQKSSSGLATIKLGITLRVFKALQSKESEVEPISRRDSVKEAVKEVFEKIKPSSDEKKKSDSKEQPLAAKIQESNEKSVKDESQKPLLEHHGCEHHDDAEEAKSAGEFGLGRIRLSMEHCHTNFSVCIHEIVNLPKEEDGEIPDPYVKLYLLPDKSRDSKRKTQVIKDNCNPHYDEFFSYPVDKDDAGNRTLQVSVINKKGIFHLKKSAIMGQVHIKLSALDNGWYDLKPAVEDDDD